MKMGSDSACISDAARSWLLIRENLEQLTSRSIACISSALMLDLATLQALAVKRFGDGLKDPLYLALLLDPRPRIRSFVKDKGLLGSSTDHSLGNTEALHGAQCAIMQMAEGVPIAGKTTGEVVQAACKALFMFVGVCLYLKVGQTCMFTACTH